jgi:cytochrome b6-f complex iron-sulfur subunit
MNATPLKDKPVSRRRFLGWLVKGSLAGSAVLGLGMLGRFISFQSEQSQPTQFDLGLASEYPVGSRTPYLPAQALITHTEAGFKAISLICPHLGCAVNITSDGFACPCHGSSYLADGSLRKGPASRPLASLKIEVNIENHLILYTD